MERNWVNDDPPSYDEVMNQQFRGANGGELTFVDFLPRCLDPGGLFTKPNYETFRSVIDRANEWLRLHPNCEVKSCESVEFKAEHINIDFEKVTYLEYGQGATHFVRGLRLWVIPRLRREDLPQQIGYTNLIPQQTSAPSIFSTPTFETVTQLFDRFNLLSRTNPLPGRVITIESQQMKLKNSSDVDPDRSYWTESGSYRKQFLFVIRIFYDSTKLASEELGVKDFSPEVIVEAGCLTPPKLQPFSVLVSQASDWCCSQRQNLRICNVQSIEVKCNSGHLDTEKTSYTEHHDRRTYYIRIIRVAFAVYAPMPTGPALRQLTCKTFVPLIVTPGVFSSKYESLSQTKARIEAWIRATGATVVSAETSAMRISTGGERMYGSEATYTYNTSEMSERWIFVIRVYLDGVFPEPPAAVLPRPPQRRNEECCVVL